MSFMHNIDLTKAFSDVDDFCKVFIPAWLQSLLPAEKPQREREFTMSPFGGDDDFDSISLLEL